MERVRGHNDRGRTQQTVGLTRVNPTSTVESDGPYGARKRIQRSQIYPRPAESMRMNPTTYDEPNDSKGCESETNNPEKKTNPKARAS